MDGYGRKSERIAGELRAAILAGRHRPGERIESENELAARYQVSRQTVRKALSALIGQGYLRAEHGRGTFVTERSRPGSRTIAVVTTYLADYIFPRVIQGIDQELAEHGYSILLKSTRNARHLEARYLEELADMAIDGLIIEPSKSQIFCRHAQLYERFDARGVPYVFIQGCFEHARPAACAARRRRRRGDHEIPLSLGQRRIAGVLKADDTQGVERHRGYVRALQEAGVLYDRTSCSGTTRRIAPWLRRARRRWRGAAGWTPWSATTTRSPSASSAPEAEAARAGGCFRRRLRQFAAGGELSDGADDRLAPPRGAGARGGAAVARPHRRRARGDAHRPAAGSGRARFYRPASVKFCVRAQKAKKQLVRKGVQVVCL